MEKYRMKGKAPQRVEEPEREAWERRTPGVKETTILFTHPQVTAPKRELHTEHSKAK